MFIEHRTYSVKPGRLQEYLEIYGADGFALHQTHAPCVGYYTSEAGKLFQIISMWKHNSFEERLERRAELVKHPVWQAKMSKMTTLVDQIESRLLVPAPFYKENR